ncbi:uncharacterized protein FOMMEDRAFT_155917 [Fomitiporia mediterranea MF3/22]|uniref:uncharacterized protein n=1 Tax=Fomitiporia mediterranea (strain MF3/22) TaxID=694068 RepID=UPI0004408475|nr:uncharacterized protein FOMMEDRAFT_155917 [Fomitiporia mediterranea MF3/22]EJD02599.1 hypothetical protein FOMMEDRAFT_155917 [Fomitiporia mediterranea MF3/22]
MTTFGISAQQLKVQNCDDWKGGKEGSKDEPSSPKLRTQKNGGSELVQRAQHRNRRA